ncbi:hypothetical protein B566_EDAN001651 [Ephemera danica]|nr:hypothetical protein B566_EDAN001651 [Ephemera danica]
MLMVTIVLASTYAKHLEWWKTTVFYQVYPRSFKDSDGDGIGDVKGITSKLDHFVDIGIGGVWLSPVYRSPMKDFGYDISNFTDIDPVFGTMEDFDELIAEIHAKGLKLVMDMVPNHSSDEHEWFIKSVAREQPYTDYYTWVNATEFNSSTGEPLPPNNWLSVFGGSAWTWSEARQQFFLHQFHEGQPDLNFRNPAVLQEIKNVMIFWLDKGVDGFRMDAVPHLMEDQTFPDEPPSNDTNYTSDQYGYLKHKFTKDLPELYNVIIELRATLDTKQAEFGRPLVMMAEAYTDIAHTMMYYGNETHPGAHFPFNFQLISYVTNDTRAQEMFDIINSWMDNVPSGAWSNWVIGNHDQPRIASRFGRDFSMALQMMSLLMPGTAVTYNGEEINMENTAISWKNTQDPQGCQAGREHYEKLSRDPERSPYQWSAKFQAGFTTGNNTWLPLNSNYVTLNLEAQKIAHCSPLKTYKKLLEARKMASVRTGNFVKGIINSNVFAFLRELSGQTSFLVAINLGTQIETVVVRSLSKNIPDVITVYATVPDDHENNNGQLYNAVISSSKVVIPPRSGIVLHYPRA